MRTMTKANRLAFAKRAAKYHEELAESLRRSAAKAQARGEDTTRREAAAADAERNAEYWRKVK